MNNRLKELRINKNLTQANVADILNIQREVYRRYETGSRSMPIELWIKLADYYDVSLDYLVGRTSENFGDA